MVRKVFWQDPYHTELDTHVKSVNGNQITLLETIFYAFSGGQESDHGTIGGLAVLEAKKMGKEIIYFINDHQFKPGDKVRIIIDWERRYKLMRLHFAAEIVLELICQKFPNIEKVGAHIAADKSRIDFSWPENFTTHILEIQEKAQNIIDLDQEVISDFSDKRNERRYWKIREFSEVPCGGTHIKRTKEIGKIQLKRVNPGKGRERIEIFVSN